MRGRVRRVGRRRRRLAVLILLTPTEAPMTIEDFNSIASLESLQLRLQDELLRTNNRLVELRRAEKEKFGDKKEAIAKVCADLAQAKKLLDGCAELAWHHGFAMRLDLSSGPLFRDRGGNAWMESTCSQGSSATDSGWEPGDYDDE